MSRLNKAEMDRLCRDAVLKDYPCAHRHETNDSYTRLSYIFAGQPLPLVCEIRRKTNLDGTLEDIRDCLACQIRKPEVKE